MAVAQLRAAERNDPSWVVIQLSSAVRLAEQSTRAMSPDRISLEFVILPAPSSGLLPRIRAAIAAWLRAAEQRDALAHFDERMLRDIGLTEADVWRSARRPAWYDLSS